jgi:hypothetical protein
MAAPAQHHAEELDAQLLPADRELVGRPVLLCLLSRCGLEAPEDLAAPAPGAPELAEVVVEDRAAALVAETSQVLEDVTRRQRLVRALLLPEDLLLLQERLDPGAEWVEE